MLLFGLPPAFGPMRKGVMLVRFARGRLEIVLEPRVQKKLSAGSRCAANFALRVSRATPTGGKDTWGMMTPLGRFLLQ